MRGDPPNPRRARPETSLRLVSLRLVYIAWLAVSLAAAGSMGCSGGDSNDFVSKERAVTVGVATVRPEQLRDVIALTGQLEAENAVVLKPELSGVVVSIEFAEGEPVKKEDVLFRLRDEEQKARLQEAQAALRLAQDVFSRTQRLTSQDISSAARRAEAAAGLDEARARVALARVQLERTRVRAPFDGVTGLRMVAPGDRVTPDDGLVSVAAIDRLQLVFTIQELGVALARTGVKIDARVVSWPGERFPGEVFFVSPTIEPATRRLLLKAWIPNPSHKLKPGMFANVDVEVSVKDDALLVPEAALVYDRNGSYVWQVDEESRAHKVPVEIGLRKPGRVEILRGVSSGDRVVASGTHKVLAGKLLKIAPSVSTHARDAAGGETEPTLESES